MTSSRMTGTTVPVVNPGAVPLVAGRTDDIPVVDFGTRSLHVVNATAAVLMLSCDGTSTVDEIAGSMAADYGLAPGEIVGDVLAGLGHLRDVGLVRSGSEAPFAVPAAAPVVEVRNRRYPDVVTCTCMTGIDEMAWQPTLSGRLGDLWLGIRTSSSAADRVVRDALAPVLDDELVADPDAPPKWSIRLVADEDLTARPVAPAGMFEDQQWLSTAHDDELLRSWIRHRVVGWRPLGPTEVRLATLALHGDEGVALLRWDRGAELVPWLQAAERGLALALAPTIVVACPSGGGPPVVRALDGSADRPVRGLVVPGSETNRLDAEQAVFPLLTLADVRPGDELEGFADGLDELARSVPVVEAAPDDLNAVAAALVRRRG